MRLQNAQWVLCSGVYSGLLMISIRSTLESPEAGAVAQKIVHGIGEAVGTVCGRRAGAVAGTGPHELLKEIEDRFFTALSCAVDKREKLVPGGYDSSPANGPELTAAAIVVVPADLVPERVVVEIGPVRTKRTKSVAG